MMATAENTHPKQEEAERGQPLPPGGGAVSQGPPPPYQPQPNYGAADPVPPSYDQAQNPAEPPPSYDSIFGQVRAAKSQSNSVSEFLKKFFVIVIGTIGCTICVGLVLAIPISMIVMGSRYLGECAREKYIPIYLIVGGVFGVVKNLSNVVQRMRNRQQETDDDNAKTNPFDGTLNCFLLGWFIAGNVWIYGAYSPRSSDPDSEDYCNPVLYNYAFWLTTSAYVLMGLVFCGLCCIGVVATVCLPERAPDDTAGASA